MFYADFVLSKKGPLSKVWLAAHWEKKLSKAQIFETDVDEAVSEIMEPSQKLALRTTGHLLLGICRVYSRKTKYLLADCNEAFLKIKLAFRHGALDEPNPVLPTFTIQDIYGEFGDNILPEFDDEELKHAPICQSRIDDITLKEDFPQKFDYSVSDALDEDDFGDAGGVGLEDYQRMFENCGQIDLMDELNGSLTTSASNIISSENSLIGREREATPSLKDAHAPGNTIFGEEDLFTSHDELMEEDEHNYQSSSTTVEQEELPSEESHEKTIEDVEDVDANPEVSSFEMTQYEVDTQLENPIRETPDRPVEERPVSPTPSVAPSMVAVEQDTVESFYERQAQKRAQQNQLNAKKRRMDDIRMITGDEMKANMADYSDTLTHLDMAPPTKKAMAYNRRSTFAFMQYFHAMNQFTKSVTILRTYQSNLTIRKQDDTENIENLKSAMALRDIGEAEMQLEQAEMDLHAPQEDMYVDDFDYVAPMDLDNFDHLIDIPRPIDEELGRILQNEEDSPAHNPLSPFATINEDEDGNEMSPDPRKKDEKDEQETDDDNRWSKRTHALLQTIVHKLHNADGGQIELEDLMKKNTSRKIAAAKFYSLLCLKKNQCVEVIQTEPYGEIKIKTGINIDVNLI